MDCFQIFGQDLQVASNGDLLLAKDIPLSTQRILRRLLTNPGTYIWDLNYGAGLPQFIGQPLSQALFKQISGLITSQMYLETSVSQTPPPQISLSSNETQLYCNIEYIDAPSNTLQVLSFTVSN